MALVEILHDLACEFSMVRILNARLGPKLSPPVGVQGVDAVAPEPQAPFAVPAAQQRLGNGIRATEGNKIGRAGLKPVRQIAAAYCHAACGIEQFE